MGDGGREGGLRDKASREVNNVRRWEGWRSREGKEGQQTDEVKGIDK